MYSLVLHFHVCHEGLEPTGTPRESDSITGGLADFGIALFADEQDPHL